MQNTRGTISFQLFGIPIFISPFSWLLLAILGGAFSLNSAEDLPGILLFVVAGMIALIVHELGHALVGRALGGDPQNIAIEGLGAATYSRPPAGRWPYFWMVLAGPLATLLPGIVVGMLMGLFYGGNIIAGAVYSLTCPLFCPPEWAVISLSMGGLGESPRFVLMLCHEFFFVSVWWCLLNLLPVLPMDGGKLFVTVYTNYRVVCLVGLVLSILIALWGLSSGSFFLTMLFVYFGYLNWMYLRHGV